MVSGTWYTGRGGKSKRVLLTGGQFHGPHGAMSLVAMPRGTVALLFAVTWHQWSLPRGTLAQVAKISEYYPLVVSATWYYDTSGHAMWYCHVALLATSEIVPRGQSPHCLLQRESGWLKANPTQCHRFRLAHLASYAQIWAFALHIYHANIA